MSLRMTRQTAESGNFRADCGVNSVSSLLGLFVSDIVEGLTTKMSRRNCYVPKSNTLHLGKI